MNSAPELPYLIVVYAAALHDEFALSPDVKSDSKVAALRPVSCGHVFSVGLQFVDVCATARGIAARAAAEDLEKRMLNVSMCSCRDFFQEKVVHGGDVCPRKLRKSTGLNKGLEQWRLLHKQQCTER